MSHEPVSRPLNLGEGVRSSGRAPAPVPPPPDPEVAAILATLPTAATEADLRSWLEALIGIPTRPGARTLSYLAEQVRARPGSGSTAADLDRLAATAFVAVEQKERLQALLEALKETFWLALTAGRGLGRAEVEEELAADREVPVLERQTKFIADEKGRIIGKTETEFRGRARA